MEIKVIKKVKLPCPYGSSEAFLDAIAVLYYAELSGERKGYFVEAERIYEEILDGEFSEDEVASWLQPTVEKAMEWILEDMKFRWAWISVGEECHFCDKHKECLEILKTLAE
jgi:pyruvoyl-dependent arginine decarboxylase (PvlArgDC)